MDLTVHIPDDIATRLRQLRVVQAQMALQERALDALVELVTEDEDTLLELLNGVIRTIPGVRDTETFMYLKLTKQTYTWGTR